jgi:Exonuclease VII, large subunit
MKKFIYSLFALAIAAMTFTSCEDVPMPYGEPTNGGDTPTTTYTGQGTANNPYTVADANNYIKAGVGLDQNVYVKGKISSVDSVSLSYGNAYYKISDDGTSTGQLIVYRGFAFGNQKFKSATEIKVGDDVVVVGKIGAYKNTYEFMQGNYITALNGKTYTPTPIGDNSIDKPWSVTKSIEAITAGAPIDSVYVTGIISTAPSFNATYGSLTYSISKEGTTTSQLQIYSGLGLGGAKFTSASDLKVGQVVEVYGLLNNNTDKPEMSKNNILISVTGEGTSTGGETGGGTAVTAFTNGDFETWEAGLPTNWKSASTASSATLSQSSDAHGGKSSVLVAGTTAGNKRLGYTEMKLSAGTYTMKFYTKAATADGGSVAPGYVPFSSDNKVGSYVYGPYVNNLTTSTWVEVTYSFTLDAETTICLVVMNPKTTGKDVLIDDFTFTQSK